MTFSVSHSELRALLRAIVEAKFHENPEDLDVVGSAILARVAARIRDQFIVEEARRNGSSAEKRWRKWADVGPERDVWADAKRNALMTWRQAWPHWAEEERRAAKDLLSPFELDEENLTKFLAEVDEALGERAAAE